jgi:hypothetical protein
MKTQMLCLSIATALLTLTANAQTIGGRLAADVPFEFTAGSAKLPAGHYKIDSPMPNIVRLSNTENNASAMLVVNSAARGRSDTSAKLVFNKYGDRCFLSSLWSPGTNSGVAVRPSAVEKELIAKANKPDTAIVVAHRQ